MVMMKYFEMRFNDFKSKFSVHLGDLTLRKISLTSVEYF